MNRSKSSTKYSWHWDKSDTKLYYSATTHTLGNVTVPYSCLDCDFSCRNPQYLFCINQYYDSIVTDLHSTALGSIHGISCQSHKPFLNEEHDRLKNDSIFSHNLWINSGYPSSGNVQRNKCACKLKYKSAIKYAVAIENKHNNELFNHFIVAVSN